MLALNCHTLQLSNVWRFRSKIFSPLRAESRLWCGPTRRAWKYVTLPMQSSWRWHLGCVLTHQSSGRSHLMGQKSVQTLINTNLATSLHHGYVKTWLKLPEESFSMLTFGIDSTRAWNWSDACQAAFRSEQSVKFLFSRAWICRTCEWTSNLQWKEHHRSMIHLTRARSVVNPASCGVLSYLTPWRQF